MHSKFWPKNGSPGILHHYAEKLVAFEFRSASQPKPDSLVFIGGLFDGLGTVGYVANLVEALDTTTWSVFQPILSSSYHGWATGNLDIDVEEIASCVAHIKDLRSSGSGRVVLMGHSTGSQDVLYYLSKHDGVRPAVDGAILQAAVSDRQALHLFLDTGLMGRSPDQLKLAYTQLEGLARAAAKQGQADETILPLSLTSQFGYGMSTPINAKRFLSLASPDSPKNPSQDDMFSSDLPSEQLRKTFGTIKARGLLKHKLSVLLSGADEAMPASIDKEALLQDWRAIVDEADPEIWNSKSSGVIPNASHALNQDDEEEPRRELTEKVKTFLLDLA